MLAAFCVFADGVGPTAQLSITGKLSPSISLVFQNNPSAGSAGFCPLSNTGTNAVGLDFGAASATTPDNLACVQYFSFSSFYLVSSAFDVVVTKTNTSSPNYQLSAQLATAPPAGVTWLVNNTTLSTSFTTIQTANTYAQPVTETLRVLVSNTVAAQTLFETINFMATAN